MAAGAWPGLFGRPMAYFLGVDAGGTHTRAVVAAADGTVLGVGAAGPGNWQAIGASAAGATIRAAVWAALGQAAAGKELDGTFFGLAGVRTEEEQAVMRAELARLDLSGALEIGGDLAVAHAGALAGGPGVVVIAGTGSAAWGRNARGQTWQAGGWGWLVDDKGGGYWLALRGLAAACEAADGRGAKTELAARAAAYFGAADLRAVLRELHAGKKDRATVAGFAREVRSLAATGDAVARGLELAAGAELLRLAEAVRAGLAASEEERTSWKPPLAVAGGLGLGPVIAHEARRRGFEPVESWGEPVLGAVLLAARAGGVELDATARERLRAGLSGGGRAGVPPAL